MKLLLTSSGFENNSIIKALADLVQKPFSKLKVAFIPTAANLEEGDKSWLINGLKDFQGLKFKSIDIVDISALPKSVWQKRLNDVDIIIVGGGNTYHLVYWFHKSGLAKILPNLLKTKIYVGISAGTVVVTSSILNDYDSRPEVLEIGETAYDDGLSLVNFMIEPHINNSYFPEINFSNLKKQSKKFPTSVYGLDDNSAIKVDGDKIEVISEGKWKLFEK